MTDITKLDKSRSFGTVTGDPHIRYVQDGHSYREDGTLYVRAGQEPPVPPPHVGTPAVTPAATEEVPEEIRRSVEASNKRKHSEAIQRVSDRKQHQ